MLHVEDYALKLPLGRQLEAVCLSRASVWAADGRADPRERLLAALVHCIAPVLDAQHRWSGLSHARPVVHVPFDREIVSK